MTYYPKNFQKYKFEVDKKTGDDLMKDITDYFKIEYNNVIPEAGRILIAEPFLGDYYFKRSIVLLIEHNDEGSFGLVVNKPLYVKLNEMLKDFPEFDVDVFLGGPVNTDKLFYIHTIGDIIEGSEQIIDGLYWGGNLEQIKELILLNKLNKRSIRFFAGYSGWGKQQLKQELERDSWLVGEMQSPEIMNAPAGELWNNALNRLGGRYVHWTRFPSDPMQN